MSRVMTVFLTLLILALNTGLSDSSPNLGSRNDPAQTEQAQPQEPSHVVNQLLEYLRHRNYQGLKKLYSQRPQVISFNPDGSASKVTKRSNIPVLYEKLFGARAGRNDNLRAALLTSDSALNTIQITTSFRDDKHKINYTGYQTLVLNEKGLIAYQALGVINPNYSEKPITVLMPSETIPKDQNKTYVKTAFVRDYKPLYVSILDTLATAAHGCRGGVAIGTVSEQNIRDGVVPDTVSPACKQAIQGFLNINHRRKAIITRAPGFGGIAIGNQKEDEAGEYGGLLPYFINYVAYINFFIDLAAVNNYAEAQNMIGYESVFNLSNGNSARVYNVFVLDPQGKILVNFAGGPIEPAPARRQ
jgi:hypothetical protein